MGRGAHISHPYPWPLCKFAYSSSSVQFSGDKLQNAGSDGQILFLFLCTDEEIMIFKDDIDGTGYECSNNMNDGHKFLVKI